MRRAWSVALVLGLGLPATGCSSAGGGDYVADVLWAVIFGDDDDDEPCLREERRPCEPADEPVHHAGTRR